MVTLILREMDGDGHRASKKPGLFKWIPGRSRNSPPNRRPSRLRETLHERRPLRSVPFVGPNCRVEPETLVTEYVEKEAKLLGTITNIDTDFNATDRGSLLKILDEQQALRQLKSQLTYDDDIIIAFSVHNIKISCRDGEKLIQRIVTHKIAAVGYVRDDQHHIIFIKFANELNPKMCNLTLLHCDSKTAAEEVCSLAQQIFQLVYTDSAIDFLNKSIILGAITPKNHSYSTDDSDKKEITVISDESTEKQKQKSVDSLTTSFTGNKIDVSSATGTSKSSTSSFPDMRPGSSSTLPNMHRIRRTHRRSGSSGSSGTNGVQASSSINITSPKNSNQRTSVHGEMQIQDYLGVLKEQFSNVEMREFAQLLQQFRTEQLKIKEFSVKLLQLYTEARKDLLLGMRHFIPNHNDLSYFNKFLKKHNIGESLPDSTISNWWTEAPGRTNLTPSETEDSSASAAGNFMAISSSESEKASTSFMSNDDSGEYKNLWNFGPYSSAADLPTFQELEKSRKSVNGTPPKARFHLIDAPVVHEPFSALQIAPVAAVPSGFQDTSNDSDSEANTRQVPSIRKSPKSDGSIKVKKLAKERQASLSPSLKKGRSPRNSKSELSPTIATERSPNSSTKRTSSDLSPMPSASHDNQVTKPQKEHRKKKKHKKDSFGVAAL